MNILLKIFLILLTLDAIFIYNMKNLFNKQIFEVQGSYITPNFLGVILSYFFIMVQLYWFIIKDKRSVLDSFILGASLYGVYEYTNLALLKNWNIETTVIDTIWGGCLFAITTYIINNNIV